MLQYKLLQNTARALKTILCDRVYETACFNKIVIAETVFQLLRCGQCIVTDIPNGNNAILQHFKLAGGDGFQDLLFAKMPVTDYMVHEFDQAGSFRDLAFHMA